MLRQVTEAVYIHAENPGLNAKKEEEASNKGAIKKKKQRSNKDIMHTVFENIRGCILLPLQSIEK